MRRHHEVAFAASVFSREAVRTSRRWQTWVLRSAFASLLFAVVVVSWTEAFQPANDPSLGAEIGRRLFGGYVYTQMALVALLAPLLVAQGILEEREESTLELLAMTHLTPAQILWGKVASRLAVLGTLVFASMPLLAASTTFGGVGPWQVVNALANTLVVLIVFGSMGGLFALIVDGTMGVLVAVATWGLAAWLLVPGLYAVATSSSSADLTLGHLSPFVASTAGNATGLLPAAAAVFVGITVARWAGPLFAVVATDPDDADHRARSPEALRVVRRSQRAGWAGLLAVVLAPLVIGAWAVIDASAATTAWPHRAVTAMLWAFSVLVVVSGTSLLVLVFLRLTEVRRVLLARRARAFAAAADNARTTPSPLWWLRGRVVGHPIVWRELATNGLGFSSVVARWSFPLWFVGTTFLGVSWLGFGETIALLALSGVMLGGVMSLTVAVETIAAERRMHTLELLSTSTMSNLSIFLGKLVSVALLGGPYLVVGIGSALLFWPLEAALNPPETWGDQSAQLQHMACGPWSIAYGAVAFKASVIALWSAVFWLAVVLAVMLGAMWVRPPRLAWVANAILLAGVPMAIGIASEILPDPIGNTLATLAFPFERQAWDAACGTSPWLVNSVLVYALAAGALFLACSASIRLVVRRDAR